jgi:hypothetical protein
MARQDVPTLTSLLPQARDIAARRDDLKDAQRALLLDAAEAGATKFVALLLDHGVQINNTDTYL